MRIYNKYILTLALAFAAANTALAFGQGSLEEHLAITAILYLAISLLCVNLNPRARRLLTPMTVTLLGGFTVIVVLRAIEVLGS